MNSDTTTHLDGRTLDPSTLARIAEGGQVALVDPTLGQMAKTNGQLLAAMADGKAIYGVTTGLGSKVVQSLSDEEINTFSLNTIRGRAHAIGAPLPKGMVRAAMAVRLNTLISGATGASPKIAQHILACLNADLIPHVGDVSSTGPADLMWGGNLALGLIGEGRLCDREASEPSLVAMDAAGITPLTLGPRDGLALVSHSGFSASLAGLGLHRAWRIWDWAQNAVAISLEGFRANLSPFRQEVLQLRHQPGAGEAGQDLLDRLEGSQLVRPSSARRLQDPLSLRNTAQVHGSVYAALSALDDTVVPELNGASDSPVVLDALEEAVSTGNFLNPYLTVALVGANYAMAQMAASTAARISRLLAERFTDLPNGLNEAAAGNAGLGPVTKVSEALCAEITRLAAPPPIYPSSSADSVEDVINYVAVAGRALMDIADRMSYLIAVELIVATQAVDLRDGLDGLPPRLTGVAEKVRKVSPMLEADRSLTQEIELLARVVLRPMA